MHEVVQLPILPSLGPCPKACLRFQLKIFVLRVGGFKGVFEWLELIRDIHYN